MRWRVWELFVSRLTYLNSFCVSNKRFKTEKQFRKIKTSWDWSDTPDRCVRLNVSYITEVSTKTHSYHQIIQSESKHALLITTELLFHVHVNVSIVAALFVPRSAP